MCRNTLLGCKYCYSTDANTAFELVLKTRVNNNLISESHLSVRLRKCKHCGQQYLVIFNEKIDWEHGEDPQHWKVLPISIDESKLILSSEKRNEQDLFQTIELIAIGRTTLNMEWPKKQNQRVSWGKGLFLKIE